MEKVREKWSWIKLTIFYGFWSVVFLLYASLISACVKIGLDTLRKVLLRNANYLSREKNGFLSWIGNKSYGKVRNKIIILLNNKVKKVKRLRWFWICTNFLAISSIVWNSVFQKKVKHKVFFSAVCK